MKKVLVALGGVGMFCLLVFILVEHIFLIEGINSVVASMIEYSFVGIGFGVIREAWKYVFPEIKQAE